MSESKEITINSLYSIVLREVENETVQEVDPGLYDNIAEFLGKIKRQEFDNVENKIKEALINMATEMTTLLVHLRLKKNLNNLDFANLLDEEKYILDSEEERQERTEVILSAMLNGKSKLLDSVSENHKTKSITVRFLKDTEQFIGADFAKYGPYKIEDLATIPYDNAQALISKEIVTKVRLED